MGWILFGLVLMFIVGRMAGSGSNGKDDFAGKNITSYFLLEEFIGEPSLDEELDQSEPFQE